MNLDIDLDLFPRAHEFHRLARCKASWQLQKRALELGQLAHTETVYSAAGTRLHDAFLNGGEDLEPDERLTWDKVQDRRGEFVKDWSRGTEFESIKEERLVVRRGLRILASGQPDEMLVQGARAAVLDSKFGFNQVAQPKINWQLALYALGVWQRYGISEITVQLFSPTWTYESFTYGPDELGKVCESVERICAALGDPPLPRAGDWCRYCQARLICPVVREEAGRVARLALHELPSGEKASKILHEIARTEELIEEIKKYYKAVMTKEPDSVPGWKLTAGTLRRWIPSVHRAWMSIEDKASLPQFLEACSMSVSNLEGLLEDKAKLKGAELGSVVEPLTAAKRTAPSLQAITKGKNK